MEEPIIVKQQPQQFCRQMQEEVVDVLKDKNAILVAKEFYYNETYNVYCHRCCIEQDGLKERLLIRILMIDSSQEKTIERIVSVLKMVQKISVSNKSMQSFLRIEKMYKLKQNGIDEWRFICEPISRYTYKEYLGREQYTDAE